MTAPHPHTMRSGRGLRMPRAAVLAAVCVVLAGAGHTLASHAAVPLWTLGVGFLGMFVATLPLAGRARSLPGIAALLAVGQVVLHTVFGIGQHGATAPANVSSAASSSVAGSVSDASLIEQAARLMCGAGTAAISPAQAQRILTDARIHPGKTGTTGTESAVGGTHAGHSQEGFLSLAADPSATGAAMPLLPSLPMLLVHVLAALATGWLMRRGDLALLRLTELSAHGVAEGTLVRSLRAALALVLALRAGLPGAPRAAPRRLRSVPPAAPTPRITALQHTVIRRGPPPAGTALALAA
ncbi:hypothetical protein [Streptomyces sp. KMM 9044]|uniref:hypothetical protein n=1 Tax=Streptomyces sp. KMM 9044 TaxID=2744474 RepID=UPI00215173FD|nr:hypothetical protein [Streptomyces sp. KMM 9044]WAX79032.1 hypothetical protein HUV60_016490 [Streptomyces sp. KMM 9044]